MSWTHRFSHAVTRRPSPSAVHGLRAVDTGPPDLDRFLADHRAYVEALRAAGAAVIELDPLDAWPDAVFVEDTALCLPEGAALLRPGAPSRGGEVPAMRPALVELYGEVAQVVTGCVEGGDILATERAIFVGRSARTDRDGIASLRAIVEPWGHRVEAVETPPGVLHLKTDCALLDAETILATPRLAAAGRFTGFRIIETAPGEEAAANAVRVNDVLLCPAGFPRTAERLDAAGYAVTPIGNREAARLDGGMSCLSLRCTPPVIGRSTGQPAM